MGMINMFSKSADQAGRQFGCGSENLIKYRRGVKQIIPAIPMAT
jgi:hypothetical protein